MYWNELAYYFSERVVPITQPVASFDRPGCLSAIMSIMDQISWVQLNLKQAIYSSK